MDEQEIRQWAWKEMATYSNRSDDGTVTKTTHLDRLEWSDQLAAWVMSGKLPEPTPLQDQ